MRNPMRIVQLIMSRQFRGAEVFAAQLSCELIKLGHEVVYISLYTVEGREFIPEGISYHDLLVKKTGGLNVELIRRLKKYLDEFEPDIVQANAGDTLKYAVLVKLIYGFSYKVVFRNASMVGQYIKSFPQKLVTSFLLRKTDFIVSVSDQTKADLLKLYPFCRTRIGTIPIGVTQKPFKRLSSFNNGRINLVHVGGFTFEKNHEGLLRIITELRKKVPTALLWLIGDGPLKEKTEETAIKLGLNNCIVFIGAVTNSLDYIHSAHALLLPSHIEGLPGVILEAFLCKTPVVAYAVGGIGEIVEDKTTGWLVPRDAEGEFVNSILEAIEIGKPVINVVDRAYSLVSSRFDNGSIAKRFLKVYQDFE
jgi:L-malate glycosyltransferase